MLFAAKIYHANFGPQFVFSQSFSWFFLHFSAILQQTSHTKPNTTITTTDVTSTATKVRHHRRKKPTRRRHLRRADDKRKTTGRRLLPRKFPSVTIAKLTATRILGPEHSDHVVRSDISTNDPRSRRSTRKQFSPTPTLLGTSRNRVSTNSPTHTGNRRSERQHPDDARWTRTKLSGCHVIACFTSVQVFPRRRRAVKWWSRSTPPRILFTRKPTQEEEEENCREYFVDDPTG